MRRCQPHAPPTTTTAFCLLLHFKLPTVQFRPGASHWRAGCPMPSVHSHLGHGVAPLHFLPTLSSTTAGGEQAAALQQARNISGFLLWDGRLLFVHVMGMPVHK